MMFHSDLTTNGQITFDAAVGEEACFTSMSLK